MAYVFSDVGFPKDVIDIIYSMRDPNSWNGDKHRASLLGRLFMGEHPTLVIERDPMPPYYVGMGQQPYMACNGPLAIQRSWTSYEDNIVIWKRCDGPNEPYRLEEGAYLPLQIQSIR